MTEPPPFDASFQIDQGALVKAVELLATHAPLGEGPDLAKLPSKLPSVGVDETALVSALAKLVLSGGFDLGGPVSFAHMDPPTPWLTWVMTLWNARLNQNLLHPATSPSARLLEERVVSWLAPYFGMSGGHMVPGSTTANLTALWAARDVGGATEIVASD
ncbi:MAG: aspartate aminotransferase family protein, partial [Hyphomonadaceae bacterium]